MTEDDARDWLLTNFPAQMPVLEQFVALLSDEAEQQSLIARSTIGSIWNRHIVDSAQLVKLAPSDGVWLDIGSGGGLPGLIIAILRTARVVLVEPRRKRADFLNAASSRLGLTNVTTHCAKAQTVDENALVLSARAVAPIHNLLGWTRQIVSRETQYLLPRGRSAQTELEIARRAWQGSFHVERSITDPESGIVVATRVAQR